MKQNTTHILNLLTNEFLGKRNEFRTYAERLNLLQNSVQDITFEEFLQQLVDGLDTLQTSIEKGIIDDLATDARYSLKNNVEGLNKFASDIFLQGSTDVPSFVNSGNVLLSFIEQYSIDFQLQNIPNYKNKIAELKELKQKLQGLLSEFEKSGGSIKKANQLLDELNEKFKANTAVQTDINAIKANVENLQTDLLAKKGDIEKLVKDITDFNQNIFIPARDSINGTQTTIANQANDIKQKHEAINGLWTEATGLLEKVRASHVEYEKTVGNLKSIDASINELFKKVNDPEQGIDKKYNVVSETKSRVDELYNKINESFKITSDLENKITAIYTEADDRLSKLKSIENNASSIQNKIDDIFKSVVPKAKGGMFDVVRKSFEDEKGFWLKVLIVTILTTSGAAVYISQYFHDITLADNWIANIVLRYAILSPLIFFIFFSSRQYKLARISFEKYTYRTVVSFSLDADIKVLQDRFGNYIDKEKGIFDFAINKVNKLYDEPYFDETMKSETKMKMEEIKYGTKSFEKNTIHENGKVKDPV